MSKINPESSAYPIAEMRDTDTMELGLTIHQRIATDIYVRFLSDFPSSEAASYATGSVSRFAIEAANVFISEYNAAEDAKEAK